jgi:hypothetical protein
MIRADSLEAERTLKVPPMMVAIGPSSEKRKAGVVGMRLWRFVSGSRLNASSEGDARLGTVPGSIP